MGGEVLMSEVPLNLRHDTTNDVTLIGSISDQRGTPVRGEGGGGHHGGTIGCS